MMRLLNRQCGLALGALLVMLVGLGACLRAEDKKNADGFEPLFNGKDFTGWKFQLDDKKADPAKTWSIKEEMIICKGHPAGFFYTDKSYKNYIMRYDWRYPRPAGLTDDSKFDGNSGALMHIHNPEKGVIGVWPNCVEVQGMNKRHGELLFIPRDQGKGKYDIEARNKATKPVGEWNTTEIVCHGDGAITAKINGTEVSSGKGELRDGQIGFQSEGAEIHFRNIQIALMKKE
jgi:hypothetical protein